ncbi:MAG: monophosphatase [Miltoncostaeaceae bacterium]|nr:monophosphatase [Miltoncostaeaceae bacterium]
MSDDALLDLALRAARVAAELLLERFGGPASGLASKTSRTDLVSDADRDAERLIVGAIRAERPGDAIVAEEGGGGVGAGGSDLRWLVDPLDGTINYLWGIPHWAVSLAVLDSQGGLVGVVLDPCRDEAFTAVRGRGARLGAQPLALAHAPPLGEALIGTGFSYRPEERARQARRLTRVLPAVRDVRRNGSAALDLAWVACGRLDGFFETALAPWDSAAGAIVVTEAGGAVAELPPSDGDPTGIVAGRPGLLEPLMALIADPG